MPAATVELIPTSVNKAVLQRTSERARLSAVDWEVAALEMIGEQGVAAVAIETLAKRLGVTKGSFYWHFSSREALIQATLERWEKNDILTFERSINLHKDPREKMRALFRRTREEVTSHVIFCALFKAADHALVGPVMQRVSERRIDFLSEGFAKLGMNAADALNRARLTYLSYVGFLQYYQHFKAVRMSGVELDEYVDHVIASLIP